MRRFTTAAILVAAALFGVGAHPVAADAATRRAPVTLTPASGAQLDGTHRAFAVSVQPGGGVWQSVVVENALDGARLTVRIHGTGAAGAWAHPSIATVVLAPHQREPVPFTIAPPKNTGGGKITGAITATVVGSDGDQSAVGSTAQIALQVTVLGAPARNADTRSGAPGAASGAANGSTTGAGASQSSGPSGSSHSSSDTITLVAVVSALALLVLAMVAPGVARAAGERVRNHRRRAPQRARRRTERRALARKRRRDRLDAARMAYVTLSERARSSQHTKRTARVADAAAATGTLPMRPLPPKEVSRSAARKADVEKRAAQRRDAAQRERERLREEAQRKAAEEWDARVRAVRERAEAEARARADAIEQARRIRAERAAALVAERRAAEERRLQHLRAAEARRREEAAERTRRRTEELRARKRAGQEAEAALVHEAIVDELTRQRVTELSRAQVVQLRSEEARDLARLPIVNPRGQRAVTPPPPLPGEHAALDKFLVELPDPNDPPPVRFAGPGEARRARRAEPAPALDEDDVDLADEDREARARQRDKVAITALDVEALNALLRQRSRHD